MLKKVILYFSFLLSFSALSDETRNNEVVINVADSIVNSIDATVNNSSDFEMIYLQSSIDLTSKISLNNFNDAMRSSRGILGDASKREILTSELKEVIERNEKQTKNYIVISYLTEFSKSNSMYNEFVTLRKDPNSEYGWSLAGYYLQAI